MCVGSRIDLPWDRESISLFCRSATPHRVPSRMNPGTSSSCCAWWAPTLLNECNLLTCQSYPFLDTPLYEEDLSVFFNGLVGLVVVLLNGVTMMRSLLFTCCRYSYRALRCGVAMFIYARLFPQKYLLKSFCFLPANVTPRVRSWTGRKMGAGPFESRCKYVGSTLKVSWMKDWAMEN